MALQEQAQVSLVSAAEPAQDAWGPEPQLAS